MTERLMRPFKNLKSGPVLKGVASIYLSVSLVMTLTTAILYFSTDTPGAITSNAFTAAMIRHAPLFLCITQITGVVLIAILLVKCHRCRSGPGRQIATALEKMSKGDLGWKITLHRDDELAEVAEYVTRASGSLADRITKLQIQARELSEIENYLIDSMDINRIVNPHTLKALRKLKICTTRLHSNMEDFHVSALATMTPAGPAPKTAIAEQLEKV